MDIKSKRQLTNMEKIALIGVKNVLDIEEVALYTGIKVATLHRLCSKKRIPYYKSEHSWKGGKSYFRKEEIDRWLTANEQLTNEEEQ